MSDWRDCESGGECDEAYRERDELRARLKRVEKIVEALEAGYNVSVTIFDRSMAEGRVAIHDNRAAPKAGG